MSDMANENLINQEYNAEYERIKGNFLERIREKIFILYQNIDHCEQECKSDCKSSYNRNRLNRKPLETPEYPEEEETHFSKIAKKFLSNLKSLANSGSTDSESTSDDGSVGSIYNSEEEEFCDEYSKKFKKNVYRQICSMPDRISSEFTQGICKLEIQLRTEIYELFKLYKLDKADIIPPDPKKIAELKADFFGRKVGGSKKTQKRRQYAKKR